MSIDLSKVIWREVEEREYNDSYFRIPHRRTDPGNGLPIYELGTVPRELPTRRGAILVPSKQWLDEHDPEDEALGWDTHFMARDVFFSCDGADWFLVSSEDGWDGPYNDLAQEVLDNGGIVVFDGIPDTITADTANDVTF